MALALDWSLSDHAVDRLLPRFGRQLRVLLDLAANQILQCRQMSLPR